MKGKKIDNFIFGGPNFYFEKVNFFIKIGRRSNKKRLIAKQK
jgi:hypothetical protein